MMYVCVCVFFYCSTTKEKYTSASFQNPFLSLTLFFFQRHTTHSSMSSSPGSLTSFGGADTKILRRTGKRAVQGPSQTLTLTHDSTIRDTRPRNQKVPINITHSYKQNDFLRDVGVAPTDMKRRVYHMRHLQSVNKTTKQRPSFVWNEEKASKIKTLTHPHGHNLITWDKSHEPVRGREVGLKMSKRGSPPSKPVNSSERTLKKDRQSNIRFFCSQPDLTKRQDLLVREGLKKGAKKSSVLGIGRGEMRSEGVNDNFGNSLYFTKNK